MLGAYVRGPQFVTAVSICLQCVCSSCRRVFVVYVSTGLSIWGAFCDLVTVAIGFLCGFFDCFPLAPTLFFDSGASGSIFLLPCRSLGSLLLNLHIRFFAMLVVLGPLDLRLSFFHERFFLCRSLLCASFWLGPGAGPLCSLFPCFPSSFLQLSRALW